MRTFNQVTVRTTTGPFLRPQFPKPQLSLRYFAQMIYWASAVRAQCYAPCRSQRIPTFALLRQVLEDQPALRRQRLDFGRNRRGNAASGRGSKRTVEQREVSGRFAWRRSSQPHGWQPPRNRGGIRNEEASSATPSASHGHRHSELREGSTCGFRATAAQKSGCENNAPDKQANDC